MNSYLDPEACIYVAGHRGMVGQALVRRLLAGNYNNLLTRTHAELDLTDQQAVRKFFATKRPDYVLIAAARVGGIQANSALPADFIYQNLMIEANLIRAAYESRVQKLLFLGSSCIYPRLASQPIKEEYLLTGPLEPTNEAYAVAKIAGIKMCAAYNCQYGTNYICVMPTNLYGPGDNYDLETSHVVPALIRKTHEAKLAGAGHVVIWGTGGARREFMFSEDLADACIFILEHCHASEVGEIINIGAGEDLTIRDLAGLVADVVGFRGSFVFDTSKPDGTPRKLLDISRLTALGWCAKTSLREGLEKTYSLYCEAAARSAAGSLTAGRR